MEEQEEFGSKDPEKVKTANLCFPSNRGGGDGASPTGFLRQRPTVPRGPWRLSPQVQKTRMMALAEMQPASQ